MPVFKKHLTPLTKKGQIDKHEGKGARVFKPAPQQSFNNFAKSTPMANPQPPSLPDTDMDGM